MVIDLSEWLQANVMFLLGGTFFICYGLQSGPGPEYPFSVSDGCFGFEAACLRKYHQKVAVARFTRTLGTMISSGVPILDGLDIVAKTAGNMVIEEELQETRASISEGKTIAEPLRGSQVFPGMMVQMVAVGEENRVHGDHVDQNCGFL